MDEEEVSTDEQISKYMAHFGGEPLVIEKKTTTTTTTTVTRICISKAANVDLTEIQTLLDNDNLDEIKERITCTVPETETNCAIKNPMTPIASQNSLLSSTKIHDEHDTHAHKSRQLRSPKHSFSQYLSPDLSQPSKSVNNHLNVSDKNVKQTTKNEIISKSSKHPKQKNNMDGPPDENEKRFTRSQLNGATGSKKNSDYINDLVNQYMTLDKRKPKQKSKPKPKPMVQPTIEKPSMPSIELKDLSAIFEQSAEGECSPLATEPIHHASPIDFHHAPPIDFHDEPIDHDIFTAQDNQCEQPNDDVANSPLKENTKNNRMKRSHNEDNANQNKNQKKSRKITTEKKTKHSMEKLSQPATKTTRQKGNQAMTEAIGHSPITIYSPSARAKFPSNADNRLILTKNMLKKQFQRRTDAPKSLLKRFDHINEMAIDENSRLVFYPGEEDDDETKTAHANNDCNDNSDIDILSILARKKKSLLVKEIQRK